MDLGKAIIDRRSVREFTNQVVGEAELNKILEAGRWTPSGLNNQPWKFMVLKDDKKDSLIAHTKYGHIIKSSNTCIAVFLDKDSGYNYVKDVQACGACIQNMLLQIHALNLGGVWLGEIINQKEDVGRTLGVGDDYELMGVLGLGYPKKSNQSSQRKELDELIIN